MPLLLAKEMHFRQGEGRVVPLVMYRKYDVLISTTYVWRKQIRANAGRAGAGKGWVSPVQQKGREGNWHENLAWKILYLLS